MSESGKDDAELLPECGLYRTGVALPGQEDKVPAGILVHFHNHSDQGTPMVLTPHDNQHNRWRFHERGWGVTDEGFLTSMQALKPEGLYTARKHIHITKEEILPDQTLLQLGYNRSGESILFVARFEANVIRFPSTGYRFADLGIQGNLEPVNFVVPAPREESALH